VWRLANFFAHFTKCAVVQTVASLLNFLIPPPASEFWMCLFYWLKSKRSKKTHMIEAANNSAIEVKSIWLRETTNSAVIQSRSLQTEASDHLYTPRTNIVGGCSGQSSQDANRPIRELCSSPVNVRVSRPTLVLLEERHSNRDR